MGELSFIKIIRPGIAIDIASYSVRKGRDFVLGTAGLVRRPGLGRPGLGSPGLGFPGLGTAGIRLPDLRVRLVCARRRLARLLPGHVLLPPKGEEGSWGARAWGGGRSKSIRKHDKGRTFTATFAASLDASTSPSLSRSATA